MPVKFKFKHRSLQAYLLIIKTSLSIRKSEEFLFLNGKVTSQQMTVLMAIKSLPDPVTQIDVATYLDQGAAGVSHIINRMVENNLVERIIEANNRRSVRLVITRKGEKLFKNAGKKLHKLSREIMSSLSEDEKDTLIKLLEKVRDKTFECRKVQDKVKVVYPKIDGDYFD